MVTIGITSEGLRFPIDVRLGKWSAPQASDEMDRIDTMYNPTVIMVESNATQDSVADWAKASNRFWWPKVRPFLTGRNKANPEHGLRSLDVEFSSGAWIWPLDEPVNPKTGERVKESLGGVPLKDHRPGCDCSWCLMEHQLRTYPACEDTDLAMAVWFCREGARTRLGTGNLIPGRKRLDAGRKDASPSVQLLGAEKGRKTWTSKHQKRKGFQGGY